MIPEASNIKHLMGGTKFCSSMPYERQFAFFPLGFAVLSYLFILLFDFVAGQVSTKYQTSSCLHFTGI